MAFNDAAKTIMLNALGQSAVFASLHTGDPALTGANEVVGSPYARQAISWNSEQPGGTMAAAVNPIFNVPGNITVNYFGLWTSGGTFLGGGVVTTTQSFGPAGGTYTLTSVTLNMS